MGISGFFKRVLPGIIFMVISIAGLTQAGDLYKPKGLKITYSFSEDGKEVNIDEPNLPEPWMNRLTNDVFHTWIT